MLLESCSLRVHLTISYLNNSAYTKLFGRVIYINVQASVGAGCTGDGFCCVVVMGGGPAVIGEQGPLG